MKKTSGYSLLEVMVSVALMGAVTMLGTRIMERINRGVSSQEILNQSRNEAMVFFQRVHHAAMTVLPNACADDMTTRSVSLEEDGGAEQVNLSVNLGGNEDPEFVLVNACVEKPVGMKKPPIMDQDYLRNIVRKDARRRQNNRMNYLADQCLDQMKIECPSNYMPIAKLVYYGRDGNARQVYFPRSSKNRRSDGTVTSFACTFKESGTGGPINVVLFAGHKDPAMQSKDGETVKWTSYRTVLPPRPTNAAYVRAPDECSANAPLPLDPTPDTAVVIEDGGDGETGSSGGGTTSAESGSSGNDAGETGFEDDDGDNIVSDEVKDPEADKEDSESGESSGGDDIVSSESEDGDDFEDEEEKDEHNADEIAKKQAAFQSLSRSDQREVKKNLRIASDYVDAADRSRNRRQKKKNLRAAQFYLSKAERVLDIRPQRGMTSAQRVDNLRDYAVKF